MNPICLPGPGLGEGGGGLLRRGDFLGISRGSISGGGQYIGSDVDCCEPPVSPELGNGHFLNKAANCSILNFGSTSGYQYSSPESLLIGSIL